MTDTRLIDALSNATSLELFKLGRLIERLLEDPKRIVPIRSRLHVGQEVQFFDWQSGDMRSGRVAALRDRQLTIHSDGGRREWKLPYAAIEPDGAAGDSRPDQPRTPPPRRDDFRVGDKVSFDDRYLHAHVGTIVRMNQRTASIDCDGQSWRVSFAGLRRLVDV